MLVYSRVLNNHVGLNKSIGRKIMENQIIVLVGINMLVGCLDGLVKVLVGKNKLVCSKNQYHQMYIRVLLGLI